MAQDSVLLIPAVTFSVFPYFAFGWPVPPDKGPEVTSRGKSQWLKVSNPPLSPAPYLLQAAGALLWVTLTPGDGQYCGLWHPETRQSN